MSKKQAPKNMHQDIPPPPYSGANRREENSNNASSNNHSSYAAADHGHNNTGSNPTHDNAGKDANHNHSSSNTSNNHPNHTHSSDAAEGRGHRTGVPVNAANMNLLPYDPPAPVPGASIDPNMIEDHISFLRTVAAFRHYLNQATAARDMRKENFLKLQRQHTDVLCIDLEEMFEHYSACIKENCEFFESICEASQELFTNYWPEGTTVKATDVPMPTPLDMDKVFSTLRQFVRDWSAEGAPERECVYKPVLDFFEAKFPSREERLKVKILIPGAGLCRLSVELAFRGFFAQANEFSYHMLIAGHYIQNHCVESKQHTIFPYCDNTCNLVNRLDQFAEVALPDFCAAEGLDALRESDLSFGELSMVAGDFTEVYAKSHQHRSWSAVTTVFFIDTAHNIIEYLQIIYDLLIPGGFWVNCGPLLYHFADSAEDMSIELSLGEVLTVAQRIGFLVTNPPTFIDTTYTNNQRSMKQLVYRCAFFVLQRPLE